MDSQDLARRWLASPHCGGWRVGMVLALDSRDYTRAVCTISNEEYLEFAGWTTPPDGIPDLSHPGTRAFLLEDVRKAWGRAVAVVMPCDRRPEFAAEIERADEWPCYWHRYTGPTEAEALILALEAAP